MEAYGLFAGGREHCKLVCTLQGYTSDEMQELLDSLIRVSLTDAGRELQGVHFFAVTQQELEEEVLTDADYYGSDTHIFAPVILAKKESAITNIIDTYNALSHELLFDIATPTEEEVLFALTDQESFIEDGTPVYKLPDSHHMFVHANDFIIEESIDNQMGNWKQYVPASEVQFNDETVLVNVYPTPRFARSVSSYKYFGQTVSEPMVEIVENSKEAIRKAAAVLDAGERFRRKHAEK